MQFVESILFNWLVRKDLSIIETDNESIFHDEHVFEWINADLLDSCSELNFFVKDE